MICKQCGAQIPDDAAECSFCGAIYTENIKPEQQPEQVQESIEDETPESSKEDQIEEILDENEIKRRRQIERAREEKNRQLKDIEKRRQQKQRKQRQTKALVALAAVVAAGGVGTGSYYLWKNHESGPDIVISTQQPVDDETLPAASTPLPNLPVITSAPAVTEAQAESTDTENGQNWRVADSGSQESGGASTGDGSSSGGGASGGDGSGSGSSGSGSSGDGSGTGSGSGTDGGSGTTGTSGGSGSETSGGTSSNASGTGSGSNETASDTVAVNAAGSTISNGTATSGTPAATSSISGETINLYKPVFSGNEYKAEGGYSDGRFSSALITGVKVIKTDDRTYMLFKFNGAEYYAIVSDDTTTEYVKNRPMTINAYKTSETYDGHPVYEITTITNYNSEYIFPNSGYELLTEEDLKGKTALQLLLGRNEIYARHGRKFQNDQIREYFESRSWYRVKDSYNYDDDSANLNTIERTNADFIKSYEDKMQNG